MKSNVFEFSSYKQFMIYKLRTIGSRGVLSRTAESMSCQTSYLSRVMNSKMQLTMDQAFLLTQIFKLPDSEKEYFLTLVEFERAGGFGYKESLKKKLQELKAKHESISEIVGKKKSIEEVDGLYFSSWHWTAVHFLTSIPNYQTAIKISQRLQLPIVFVEDILKQLEGWGYVSHQNKQWKYKSGEFHLPKSNPFTIIHHNNWRNKAILDSQNLNSEGLHYTNIQTASVKDIEKLKELFLDFIKECNYMLGPSQPEESIAICLDLFSI